jgi:hypothetical protein
MNAAMIFQYGRTSTRDDEVSASLFNSSRNARGA